MKMKVYFNINKIIAKKEYQKELQLFQYFHENRYFNEDKKIYYKNIYFYEDKNKKMIFGLIEFNSKNNFNKNEVLKELKENIRFNEISEKITIIKQGV